MGKGRKKRERESMLSFGIQVYFKTSPEGEPFQSCIFEQNEPVRKTGCFLDSVYMQIILEPFHCGGRCTIT